MKRGDILNLFEILKRVNNDLDVVYAYLKLEPICDEIHKFRIGTVKKLAGDNHDEVMNKVSNQQVLSETEVEYYNKFMSEFSNVFNKYLDEDVDLELPKVDVDNVIKNNELSVPESGFLINTLK